MDTQVRLEMSRPTPIGIESRRMRRERIASSPNAAIQLLLLISCLLLTSCFGGGDGDKSSSSEGGCETESDLRLEGCALENLPLEALTGICERIGLDVEMHVFPLIDEDEEELAGGGGDDKADAVDLGGESKTKERSHSDYVSAAQECLLIEMEMQLMEEEDPEALAELERSLLAEDPDLLAEVVAEVLAKSPELMHELQIELEREDPEFYQDLMEELGDDESLSDRPEILAELVAVMLAEDPDMLEKLDEDLFAMMDVDDFDPAEDDSDGVGNEL